MNRIEELYTEDYQLPVRAVLHGDYPGKAFVDDVDNPTCSVVWVMNGSAYFGASEKYEINEEFVQLFFRRELPNLLLELGDKFFEVYGLGNNTKNYQRFRLVEKHNEVISVLEEEVFEMNMELDDSFKVTYRNQDCCKGAFLKKHSATAERPKKRIAELWDGNTIVARSEDLGFTYNKHYLINVHTINQRDRNRGFGMKAVQALMNEYAKDGYYPYWETRTDNHASLALSKKLGFKEKGEYEVAVYQWI